MKAESAEHVYNCQSGLHGVALRWLFFIVCVFPFLAFAQTPSSDGHGSQQVSADSLPASGSQSRNLPLWREDRVHHQFDSLKDRLQANAVSDTSRYYHDKLDSISSDVDALVDSLHDIYATPVKQIIETQNRLSARIDSLTRLNLPTGTLPHQLDSTRRQLTDLQHEIEEKIQSVQARVFREINAIEFPPELKSEVSELQSSLNRLTSANVLNRAPLNLPGMNGTDLLRANLPGLPHLPTGGLNVPGVNTGMNDIPSLNNIVPNGVNTQPGVLTDGLVPEGMTGVTGKASEVQQLGSQSIDKMAEGKVSSLSQVQEIQEMSQVENVDALKSEEAMKARLTNHARTAAVDHFAGKQEQVKAAMEKLSKYKAKYSSVSSITELKEKPRNTMKKKPLAERLVPGIGLQVQRKGDYLLVDFNPYVGYRLTGRITAGAGWNQRLGYSLDHYAFSPGTRIFGPRFSGEFRLGKGFSPRLEAELMNTQVPPATLRTSDPQNRQWVPGVFAGMKKEYQFIGRVKGTASVMIRLFDPKRQSPYADVINARFGFEFPLKKKTKQSE